MVGKQNSTILTVSYGTFSCTLEGFDDSFGMMKAIAEYFRDLAADDRYFGAEPPTPDVDMLAKIAEQNVARRVEARSENGGVVLRPYALEDAATAPAGTATDIAAAKGDTAETQAAAPEAAAAAQATPAVKAQPPVRDFVDESDDFFGASAHGAMLNEESVAARLQRIREAARAKATDAILEDTPTASAPQTAPKADAQARDVDDQTQSVAADKNSEPVAETKVQTPVAEAPHDALPDEDTPPVQPEAQPAERIAFDEPEEDLEADIDQLMALDGIADPVSDEGDSADKNQAADPAEDTELQALLGALETQDADADAAAADQDLNDSADKTDEPIPARILHVKGAALQDMENLSPDDLIGYDDDAYDAPENTVDTESLNAIFDDTKAVDTPSSLSEEEEADLLRELAEVEAEESSDYDGELGDLLDADTEAVVTDEEHLFTAKPEEALASAQDLSSLLTERQADEEVGRLMAETESQLSKPEHTRRKTTIQHLKAAFAAKRAEGDDVDHGNDSVAYREDFEMAIKPRRPILGTARKTERLRPSDAAPLKLVAEQRVVPEKHASEPAVRPTLVKPVRPRRIQTGSAAVAEHYDATDAIADQETPENKVDFPTFAEHMGVDKLPELLEAAAAYMAFVQDYEKFSRPQVMTLVREVLGERYTREDGLRAFGQLLREGKLIRLEGGRFTVSDGIGFQPN